MTEMERSIIAEEQVESESHGRNALTVGGEEKFARSSD
jgi:hypothetical protein